MNVEVKSYRAGEVDDLANPLDVFLLGGAALDNLNFEMKKSFKTDHFDIFFGVLNEKCTTKGMVLK